MLITTDKLKEAVRSLDVALNQLDSYIDVTPLREINSQSVLAKVSVMACECSPDHYLLERLFSGGMDAVRAFSHLATELSLFTLSDLNIWAAEEKENTDVKNRENNSTEVTEVSAALALKRMDHILSDSKGREFWQCSHCEALTAEFGMLVNIAAAKGITVAHSALIACDPHKNATLIETDLGYLSKHSDSQTLVLDKQERLIAMRFYDELYADNLFINNLCADK